MTKVVGSGFSAEQLGSFIKHIIDEVDAGRFTPYHADCIQNRRNPFEFPKWMTPPEQQAQNMLEWQKLHKKWEYGEKGEFPKFNEEKLLENIPPMPTGNKPVITLVPYLAAPMETLMFIVDVVWPYVYGQCDWNVWVWDTLRPFDKKIHPMDSVAKDWQSGVRWCALDLERYPEKDGHSAQSVREKGDLLSVEPLMHFAHASHDLMALDGSHGHRYVTITGFRVGKAKALCVGRDLDDHSIYLSADVAGNRHGYFAVAAPPGT